MAAAPAYDTRAGDPARERDTVLALWRTGFVHAGSPEAKLTWYYDRNPEGPPALRFLSLRETGRPVGVATIGRRRMRTPGGELVAGFLADFIVEPGHRGLFPALHLQREVLRHGTQQHRILFGLPNTASEAVVKRAGYRRLGTVVRSVRVLRTGSYLARRMPGWLAAIAGFAADRVRLAADAIADRVYPALRVEWLEAPDASFDDLWLRTAARPYVIGVRDRAYLHWRFVEYPYARHRFAAVRGPGGQLLAYAVCHVEGPALVIADFLYDAAPPAEGALPKLLLALARDGWERGLRSLSVDFFGAPHVQQYLSTLGMRARSERSIYAAFAAPEGLDEASHWYVTAADEDA
jgi:hypothetical protein